MKKKTDISWMKHQMRKIFNIILNNNANIFDNELKIKSNNDDIKNNYYRIKLK